MKVLDIRTDSLALAVTPMGDRIYRLARDTKVTVATDEGCYVFKFKAGFVTNFRSGGVAVDIFVDQVGDEKKALCYLVHDGIYTPCDALGGEHPMSRIRGDQLLRAMLLWAEMHRIKAEVVYNAVRLCGHSAYWNDDRWTSENRKMFGFEWGA